MFTAKKNLKESGVAILLRLLFVYDVTAQGTKGYSSEYFLCIKVTECMVSVKDVRARGVLAASRGFCATGR